MTKKILSTILFALTLTLKTEASVQVLFHPHDPTLAVIAQVFAQSHSSAQVVLYNVDVSDLSPVIQYIQSPAFQKKLKQGFKFQLIFEGYATPEENFKKMQALEDLGIDVRYLGASQKVHHKFALFDAGLETERLVTGSANWSLGSMNNYDENILFIENEKGISAQFSAEFSLLWNHAQEFGHSVFPEAEAISASKLKGDLHGFFNSNNFEWTEAGPQTPKQLNPALTKIVVSSIDRAQKSIEVASTRIKLAPVYEALMRAASRGVEIKIVVSQAEYLTAKKRQSLEVKECGEDLYNPKCSVGMNFSPMLAPEVTGHENMQIRLKFFSLNLTENIAQQMHNKYMIIDGRWILSGSFNWSNSSEWQHIENIVVIDGAVHRKALVRFQSNYHYLWNMNRSTGFGSILTTSCRVAATVMTFQEIDSLRKSAANLGVCLPN